MGRRLVVGGWLMRLVCIGVVGDWGMRRRLLSFEIEVAMAGGLGLSSLCFYVCSVHSEYLSPFLKDVLTRYFTVQNKDALASEYI